MIQPRSMLAVLLLLGLASPGARADGPVAPAEAPGRMTVPEGFRVTLFAAEPDVRQPIAFAIDARGRLWVAENFSYPNWKTKAEGRDRIVIFEDVDGDGRFDKRKVFWDRGANLTGLALGFGGVWACETPNLVFIPDRDGDDVPDGEPTVELDGWDVKGEHNLFNGLNWGPDGWLYGCNGILSNSEVGRPGTPAAARVAINCGVWRFHPTRKVFEVVAHGTTNPWGLDFDDHGQAFITNCVIPHLYRVVPGARFRRMFGEDFNRSSYALMETAADHIHWAGGNWTDSRGGRGAHGDAGGGHAHVGAMIYLGDNWPAQYRDSLFTCNLHGNRVNNDGLRREGSGYVAGHRPDFLKANDPWFRGMELKYGPDGGVFLTDWSDTGECHDTDADGPHRENGRIYKITYGRPSRGGARPSFEPDRPPVDLARAGPAELAALQSHPNDWHVRTARRILQERAASGADMARVHDRLRAQFGSEAEVTRKLRALWALHATGGLDDPALVGHLGHAEEWVRAWAVRLLVDSGPPSSAALARFEVLSRDDPSPLVRLELASALQKIPTGGRRAIAEGLVGHAEDAADPSIPLMTWYGVEPLVAPDRAWAAALASRGKVPLIRRHIARRLVAADDRAGDSRGVAALLKAAGDSDDTDFRIGALDGLAEATRGRRASARPEGWDAAFVRLSASPDERVRDRSRAMALRFGDARAAAALRAVLGDESVALARRLDALRALAGAREPGLPPLLLRLLDRPGLRGEAIRALAGYDDPATPAALIRRYPGLTEGERADVVVTLTGRASYALALLEAVRAGAVPRRDLSATTARQVLALGDPKVARALEESWGTIRPTSADKAALMARYKALLVPDRLKGADPSGGRAVFGRNCVACHRLFGEGGEVGPELTGSDRANLDYVLENVLDPSASVAREYRLATVATADGRVFSGLLREQGEKTLVVQTTNERVALAREDVAEIRQSALSMMPEGLFDKLTDDEVRDLVAYLASRAPIPPAGSRP